MASAHILLHGKGQDCLPVELTTQEEVKTSSLRSDARARYLFSEAMVIWSVSASLRVVESERAPVPAVTGTFQKTNTVLNVQIFTL
jgi:hypothetical protein